MALAKRFSEVIEFLETMGAREVVQNGQTSLFDHLCSVADRLARWDCSEQLIYAGLLSCVYKTAAAVQRQTVGSLVGRETEELVYLYHIMDNAHFWDNALDRSPFKLVDRKTRLKIEISEAQYRDLLVLLLASEMDSYEYSLDAPLGPNTSNFLRVERDLPKAAYKDFLRALRL